jgi:hypothetical protein
VVNLFSDRDATVPITFDAERMIEQPAPSALDGTAASNAIIHRGDFLAEWPASGFHFRFAAIRSTTPLGAA